MEHNDKYKAYLIEMKWIIVEVSPGLSLSSFLCGKSIWLSASNNLEMSWPVRERLDDLWGTLRQIRLGDEWKDLFRVLLLIGQTFSETSSSLWIAVTIQGGSHEFIDWLFRETDFFDSEIPRFNLMCYTVMGLTYDLRLRVMETAFTNGMDGRVVFPLEHDEKSHIGRPMCHCALLKMQIGGSSRVGRNGERYDQNDADKASVIELWLRHGANPRVRFRLSEDGRKCIGVSSAPDNLGFISCKDVDNHGHYEVRSSLQGKGKRELSLREIVMHWKPHNESILLDLLKDDTENDSPSVEEAPKIEPDSSESGSDHGEDSSAPQEATIDLDHPELGAASEEDCRDVQLNQWLGGWAMKIRLRLYIRKTIQTFLF
ncbi:hypothetical protein F4823DRAFT_80446 [Ustulina deusta]|nr:hypothetical protein F4823DRAFT_80446 [Ustulina deusta]